MEEARVHIRNPKALVGCVSSSTGSYLFTVWSPTQLFFVCPKWRPAGFVKNSNHFKSTHSFPSAPSAIFSATPHKIYLASTKKRNEVHMKSERAHYGRTVISLVGRQQPLHGVDSSETLFQYYKRERKQYDDYETSSLALVRLDGVLLLVLATIISIHLFAHYDGHAD